MVGTKETGEVKNSMGNGEAKELICMTRGHELRWRNELRWVNELRWGWGTMWRGIKGGKSEKTVLA